MENSIKINKHYYWIDLLRFTAAFLVMLVHFRGMFFVEYRLLPESNHNIIIQIFYLFTRFGKEPVIVFFVLSGFLVGGKSIQQILNNDINIKSYFIDRSVRIFLPLIASSLLLVLIQLLIKSPIPFVEIVGSFFSVQGIFVSTTHNPPLWSLSYEVWFYLMMGCIMTISITKKGNSKSIFPFLILSLCMLVFMKLNPLYLFIWFMGAFAYLLPRENISYKNIKIPLLLILLCFSFILSQSVSDSRSIKFVLVNFF
jgi:peptidoglycan/LPS O-acetylase OafA/YrhL